MNSIENRKLIKGRKEEAVFAGPVDSIEKAEAKNVKKRENRLLSLDFYRGLIMVLLMMNASGLFHHIVEQTQPMSFGYFFAIQFTHHPWNGLHFWDLIQPAFMFIAGTAMAFSVTKQFEKGLSWNLQLIKTIKRSGWLFFWGIFIYAVKDDGLSFELWNVLTQLSFTLLLAFFIFSWKPKYQILFSFGLLLVTEILYRFTEIPGFDQPFTDQNNFGNYLDLVLMNKINSGGWVAINVIPTAAHTIWGAVAGKWLLTRPTIKSKIISIVPFGITVLFFGYAMEITGVSPLIKKIATTSFTLVSGGWCLLILALFYYWIDVLKHTRHLEFFTIVGMNSIFIYLFFEIVVRRWLYDYTHAFVTGLLVPMGIPLFIIMILAAMVLFMLQWYLCLWLYRRKIFFKV